MVCLPAYFSPRPWGKVAWVSLALLLAAVTYQLAGPLHQALDRGWTDLATALMLSGMFMLGSVLVFAAFRWFAIKIFIAPRPAPARARSWKRRPRRKRRRQQ